MPICQKNQPSTIYQITIQGNLDSDWSNWFSWLELSHDRRLQHTTLTGAISDQAELRGILNKLWDLNQIVIAVSQL